MKDLNDFKKSQMLEEVREVQNNLTPEFRQIYAKLFKTTYSVYCKQYTTIQ